MADYVSREVARERLRAACKGASAIAAIVLLAGLVYGGIAAIFGLGVALPFEFLYTIINAIVPESSDTTVAVSESATRAFILVLMGLLGLLMVRKVRRTGEAFRAGQLKQLKFIAFLSILLGFVPSVASNIVRFVLALRAGQVLSLSALSLAFDPMCMITGILVYTICRVMVAGANVGLEEEELEMLDPGTYHDHDEPDFMGVPDLEHVPTAVSEETVDDTAYQPPMV